MQGRVLVVDDDNAYLDLLKEIIEAVSIPCDTASDPAEALKEFKTKRHNLVLLDYNMPIVNGDKLVPHLHQLNPDVKIIVLTGAGSDEVEFQFKGLSYYAFMEKGNINVHLLRELIKRAFAEGV